MYTLYTSMPYDESMNRSTTRIIWRPFSLALFVSSVPGAVAAYDRRFRPRSHRVIRTENLKQVTRRKSEAIPYRSRRLYCYSRRQKRH